MKINNKLPVYVVDDDQSVRESLSFMLEGYDFPVTSFEDGQEFIDNAPLELAGCVVLDSRMPRLRGQQVHQILTERASPLGIIFLTGHGDVPMAVEALKLGAVDFFPKPVDGDKLAQSIEKACEVSKLKVQHLGALSSYRSLTAREVEILKLVVQGKRNQQIADEICIAIRTLEIHKANIMKKFSAKTVAELVMDYSAVKALYQSHQAETDKSNPADNE